MNAIFHFLIRFDVQLFHLARVFSTQSERSHCMPKTHPLIPYETWNYTNWICCFLFFFFHSSFYFSFTSRCSCRWAKVWILFKFHVLYTNFYHLFFLRNDVSCNEKARQSNRRAHHTLSLKRYFMSYFHFIISYVLPY